MTWPAVAAQRGSLQWFRREVALRMGYAPDPSVLDNFQLGNVDSVIESGLNRFYYPPPGEFTIANASEAQKERLRRAPYSWSFLKKIATINMVAAQTEYDLPSDFASFIGEPTSTREGGRLAIVNEGQLRQLIDSSATAGSPNYVAIRYSAGDGSARPAPKLVVYPIPVEAESIKIEHSISAPSLAEANPWPLSGVEHAETILACCYAVIAERGSGDAALSLQLMMQRLTTSISSDMLIGASTGDGVWEADDETLLENSRAYIEKMIGIKLGYGASIAAWTDAQSRKVAEIIKAAWRRIASPPVLPGESLPHQWSWLKPLATLTTVAGQSTYDLPTDFADFYGPMTHEAGGSTLYGAIERVGEVQLRHRLQMGDSSGRPQLCAIRFKSHSSSIGTRYELLLWPIPDAAYNLDYKYKINLDTIG